MKREPSERLNTLMVAYGTAVLGGNTVRTTTAQEKAAIKDASQAVIDYVAGLEAIRDAAQRVERGLARSRSNGSVSICGNGTDALDAFDLLDNLRAALASTTEKP